MQVESDHDLVEIKTGIATQKDGQQTLEREIDGGSGFNKGTAADVNVSATKEAEASVKKLLADWCWHDQ